MENSTLKLVADTNNCASLLKQSLVSYIIQCVSLERHHVIRGEGPQYCVIGLPVFVMTSKGLGTNG